MREDIRALAYLAWRQIVNNVRTSLKNPARIILWVMVALSLGLMLAARVITYNIEGSLHRHLGGIDGGLIEPLATAISFGFLILLAINIGIAAGGNVAGFSCEADARFLTLSGIAPRRMLAWLQVRGSAKLVLQGLLLGLFYSMLFSGAGRPLSMILTIVGAILLVVAIRMPVLRARLRLGTAPFMTIAILLGAFGAIGLVLALAPMIAPSFAGAGAYVIHLGFGEALRAMLAGSVSPLLILWLLGLGALALGYFGSTDVVPEVYAASLRALATAARKKGGLPALLSANRGTRYVAASSASTSASASAGTSRAWRGALALVWKDWLAFSRTRGAIVRSIVYLLGGLIAGGILGMWTRRGHDAIFVMVQVGTYALLFLSIYSSVGLNADLGKPLWWLNADALSARLWAWVLSATWRGAALGAALVLGYAAAIGSMSFVLYGLPIVIGMIAYLRCIGLALYAMFPSQLDQKGPVAVARAFLAFALLLPVGVGAGIAGGFFGYFAAGTTGLVAAAIESLILVGFAANRIHDNGLGLARAEAA